MVDYYVSLDDGRRSALGFLGFSSSPYSQKHAAFWTELFDDYRERFHSKVRDVSATKMERLIRLIFAGSTELAVNSLDQKDDVNFENENGMTPLIAAVITGDARLVAELLERGASSTRPNRLGLNARDYGQSQGSAAILKALNPDFEISAADLVPSIISGDLESVQLILELKIDRENMSWAGWTPVHIATLEGQHEILEHLIGAGFFVNEAIEGGITPLMIAAMNGDLEAARILSPYSDVSAVSDNYETALDIALAHGHSHMVGSLLGNSGFATARFLEASATGALEIIDAAIMSGIDVNTPDDDGWTAVMYSIYAKQEAVFTRLIREGADVNSRSADGTTLLMVAVATKDQSVVEHVLREGADPIHRNKSGMSAEQIASEIGLDSIAQTIRKAAEVPSRKIQSLLAELGYYTGKVDGIMGPQTRSALADFEERYGPRWGDSEELIDRLTYATKNSVRLCNKTPATVSFAIHSKFKSKPARTRGWYTVKKDRCLNYATTSRNLERLFFYAKSHSGQKKISWTGKKEFCVKMRSVFDYPETVPTQCAKGAIKKGFYEVKITPGKGLQQNIVQQ